MAKLTEDMKNLVASQLAYIATATPEGIPNIGPKGSTRVLDDEHIVFSEIVAKHHFENLRKNPKVAIAVVDAQNRKGYRFAGTPELVSEGPLYEAEKQQMQERGLPPPPAVVKVRVDEIYNLGIGAPGPGERLEGAN